MYLIPSLIRDGFDSVSDQRRKNSVSNFSVPNLIRHILELIFNVHVLVFVTN